MTKVSSTAELPVSAKTVWAVIGNFNALPDWHPAVEKSEMKKRDGGTLRKLSLVGGGTIEEKLEKIDAKERRYTYSIVSGSLPVTNYTSTLKVRDDGSDKGCTVEWSSKSEAKVAPQNDTEAALTGTHETRSEEPREAGER